MKERRSGAFRRRPAVWALAALIVLPAAHGALSHGAAICGPGDPVAGTTCQVAEAAARPDATSSGELCPWCLASSQARTLLRPAPAAALCEPGGIGELDVPPAPSAPTPRARGLCASRAPPTLL